MSTLAPGGSDRMSIRWCVSRVFVAHPAMSDAHARIRVPMEKHFNDAPYSQLSNAARS
jgi:hypothetical protein